MREVDELIRISVTSRVTARRNAAATRAAKRRTGDPKSQGDTPVAEVLRLLKTESYPIAAIVEYEYMGKGSAVEEVNACVRYIREAVA